MLSTPAFAVAPDVTGILKTVLESTAPSSWSSVTAVLVESLATSHLPFTAFRFVTVPSGIVTFALVAPLDILTGTEVE